MNPVKILLILLTAVLWLSCQRGSDAPSAQSLLEQGETALAHDSVQKGETLLRRAADTAAKEADWHTQYIALQRLAESVSWSSSSEALTLMHKALDVYEQHPDNPRNYILLLDYAGAYAAQKAYNDSTAYEEALQLTQKAHQLALETQEADLVCSTLMSLANICWAQENYPQALDYALRADSQAVPELKQGSQQVLARCYLSCDSLARAEAIYKQIEIGDDLHLAYIVQSNLAKIAVRRNAPEEAEAAIDSSFEQAEELYFKALGQKDDYYQQLLQQEQEQEQMKLVVTLITAGCLLLLAAVVILHYRLRNVRQRRRYELERQQHRLQLAEQKKTMAERQAQSQQELLRQADEMIRFLQNFILQRSESIQRLMGQDGAKRTSFSDSEWHDVERTLNAIDAHRFKQLRQQYPTLTDEDLRLCLLIRLGLSNRAIGNVFYITISAVQHRKLRIKKEVFGIDDPNITLEQLISRPLYTDNTNS